MNTRAAGGLVGGQTVGVVGLVYLKKNRGMAFMHLGCGGPHVSQRRRG